MDMKLKGIKCSFCGKSSEQVIKIITGPSVNICNECIAICNQLLVDTGAKTTPKGLNQTGKELSNYVNATFWALEEAPKLVDEAKGKTRYEIQLLAFRYVTGFALEGEMKEKIHNFIYDRGIDISNAEYVLGICLRDAIFVLIGYEEDHPT